MALFYFVRKFTKKILAKYFLVIEYCLRCGVKQPIVWRTDDVTWCNVTGSQNGVFCPKCFDLLAIKKDIPLMWLAKPMWNSE